MKVHFPPNGPLGLGLGKCRELLRPCIASERCPAPYFFVGAFSKTNSMRAAFDQERERRAEARRFQSEEDRLLALLGSRIPRHMRLFTG
jgi:hypothetical protein